MEIVHTHCAGLDVHKKTVVAAIIVPDERGGLRKEVRTFGTLTSDLLALSDWLMDCGITHVAMESTGEYWKPVFNILENSFEVLLVNAQHIKAVPGRHALGAPEGVRQMSRMRNGLPNFCVTVCSKPALCHPSGNESCAI
jgi:hypothetical protein